MRQIPVDPSLLFLVLGVAPAMRDGQPRTGEDGQPLMEVTAAYMPGGADRPEMLTVRVPAAKVPTGLSPATPVRFEHLTARPWQMDGRGGVAYSADALIPVQPQPQPQAQAQAKAPAASSAETAR